MRIITDMDGFNDTDGWNGMGDSGDGAVAEGGPRELVAINADSRALEPTPAGRRVAETGSKLQRIGCDRFFKFVDSSLRGNVGAELDGLLARLDTRECVVIPGTPEVGRTVVDGRLLVFDVPAHLSEVGLDPINPVRTAMVVDIFGAQSRNVYRSVPVGLDLEAAVSNAWRHREIPILDAPDMDAIRAAVRQLGLLALNDPPEVKVVCGSVGLIEILADVWGPRPSAPARRVGGRSRYRIGSSLWKTKRRSDVLVISGSTTNQTARQLEVLEALGVPLIKVGIPLSSDPDEVASSATWLLGELRANGVAALISALGSDDVSLTLSWAVAEGLREADVVREIPDLMGQIARCVVERAGRDGRPVSLVLVGGMAAMGTLKALGVSQIIPEGEEDLVVFGRVAGGPLDGLALATKGGASGHDDALVAAVERLAFNYQ